MTGELTVASMEEHAIDERYYAATIAKVGEGNPVTGHASYYEHRADAPSASLAPAAEGLMMRWLQLSLPVTMLLGDMLFPFAAIFVLALGLRRFLGGSILLAGAAAVFIGSDIGTYWLRSANPQIPFVGVAAWLAVVCTLPLFSRRSFLLRALAVAMLLWTQVVYASFFLIADGVLTIAEMIRQRSWRAAFGGIVLYGAVLALSIVPRVFLGLPTEVAEDTFYRLGIVLSHAPAAPRMQLFLLGILVLLLLVRRYGIREGAEWVWRCTMLIVASLVALNQSVIHGIDATFVSYYQPLIRIIVMITFFYGLSVVLRTDRQRRLVFMGCSALSLCILLFSVQAIKTQALTEEEHLRQTGVLQVLEWLRSQDGTFVVAAPNVLNERIPAETQHYVLFNEYGWNQPMTDRELAERYALQARLIPSSVAQDRTYTFVFGGHAGLQSAKERTLCRLLNGLGMQKEDCAIDARSRIRHQELLPIVDNALSDIPTAMRQFHVRYIITAEGDSGEIPATCSEVQEMGIFTIRACL